jgi:hypothetical protein
MAELSTPTKKKYINEGLLNDAINCRNMIIKSATHDAIITMMALIMSSASR